MVNKRQTRKRTLHRKRGGALRFSKIRNWMSNKALPFIKKYGTMALPYLKKAQVISKGAKYLKMRDPDSSLAPIFGGIEDIASSLGYGKRRGARMIKYRGRGLGNTGGSGLGKTGSGRKKKAYKKKGH